MELQKAEWKEKDKFEFKRYLENQGNPNSIPFAVKIINTSKPMVGINMPTLRGIAKEIAKGDFMSFLSLDMHDYYENEIINCALICKIKDFSTLKDYLLRYGENADSWAEIDAVKVPFGKKNHDDYLAFAKKCSEHEKPFVRRLGVILLFACLNGDDFESVKSIIASLKGDEEYYVNMAVAWLVCEMVIKLPDQTIPLVNRNFLNEFALRKAISKCSDSFRVSDEVVSYLKNVNK